MAKSPAPAAVAPVVLLALCAIVVAVWGVRISPASVWLDQLKLGGALALLTIVSLLPAAWYWIHDRGQIVNPMSLQGGSFFFFGVIATILTLRNTSLLTAGETSVRHLPFAICLMTLGFLCFCGGYSLIGMGKAPRGTPAQADAPVRSWQNSQVALAFAILVAAAWIARGYAAGRGFVATKFLTDTLTGNPILIALYLRSHALIALAAAIALLFTAQRGPSDRRRRSWQIMAVALLVLETVYFGLIQLTRMQALYGWSAALCVLILAGRTPWRITVVVALLFLGVLFPLVLRARQLAGAQSTVTAASGFELVGVAASMITVAVEDVSGNYLASLDDSMGHSTHFSNADELTAFIEEQDEKGLPPMGLDPLMQSAIQLVPRVIWPSKPIPYDKTRAIKAYYGYWDDDDVMVSPVNELYACFGIFGIIIGMGLNGAVLKLVFQTLLSGARTLVNSGTALYAAFAFELSFVQTDLVATLAPLRDLLLLWLFLSWVFRTQNDRQRVGSIRTDAFGPIKRLPDVSRRPA